MTIRLTWVRETCGHGKTCPKISGVTERGTRIVIGKKITDPATLAAIGAMPDDEYAVEVPALLIPED
ncbi:MAG: hypothetical protein H0X35_13520 [Pseudonocardiales bacterium]|nr:hypothetical protein [Pseudonocardiales bacterium]